MDGIVRINLKYFCVFFLKNILEKKYLVSESADLSLFSLSNIPAKYDFPFITITQFIGSNFHLGEMGIIRVDFNRFRKP